MFTMQSDQMNPFSRPEMPMGGPTGGGMALQPRPDAGRPIDLNTLAQPTQQPSFSPMQPRPVLR